MSDQNKAKDNSDKADRDNRSNQLNPNNDAYWKSRDSERPKPKS